MEGSGVTVRVLASYVLIYLVAYFDQQTQTDF